MLCVTHVQSHGWSHFLSGFIEWCRTDYGQSGQESRSLIKQLRGCFEGIGGPSADTVIYGMLAFVVG